MITAIAVAAFSTLCAAVFLAACMVCPREDEL